MAQIVIDDVDDALIERLERQAERERTRQSPRLRDLLSRALDQEEQSLRASKTSQAEARAAARSRFDRITTQIREKTRGVGWDTTALIREDRDR